MSIESDADKLQGYWAGVKIVSKIFQGRCSDVGVGVCRGIVSYWIAAHLGSSLGGAAPFIIEEFRRDAATMANDRKAPVNVKQFHRLYDSHQANFVSLRSDYRTARDEARDYLTDLQLGTPGHSLVGLGLKDDARDDAYDAAVKAGTKANDSFSLGQVAAQTATVNIELRNLGANLGTAFTKGNGFYAIVLSDKHGFGCYYQADGRCLFLDPNTCEWLLWKPKHLGKFITKHMATFYNGKFGVNWMREVVDKVHYFPGAVAVMPEF